MTSGWVVDVHRLRDLGDDRDASQARHRGRLGVDHDLLDQLSNAGDDPSPGRRLGLLPVPGRRSEATGTATSASA